MYRLLCIGLAVALGAWGIFAPRAGHALTAADVVYQPVNAASDAVDRRFQDKFVYYERDGFFVPTRMLIESDIKACVDLQRRVCSTRYDSRAEVLKASSLYFAFPMRTAQDIIRTNLRPAVGNDLMHVVTTRSMTARGLLLKIEVEKGRVGSAQVSRYTRWARFTPSRRYAGLRMDFGEQIASGARLESLTGVRREGLRNFADAAIRINNHFYSQAAGGKRIRHGSGFFYRSRDQIMTAWHNLAPNDHCRKYLRCELRFLHTSSRGVKRRFTQTVNIIAHDRMADFAVLRLRLPRDIPARVLPIARDKVGPQVSIVGYPAPGFDLLYSHGYLNSLAVGGDRLVASAHVVGGFSGAPVVDLASGHVVGFAKAWQRPRGQAGEGGPVSLNLVTVLEHSYGIRTAGIPTGRGSHAVSQLKGVVPPAG